MRSLLLVLVTSQAFAQPVSEAERKKILHEMRTCLTAADQRAADGDALFRRGKYAEAVRAYESSMGCEGTVPRPHEKAKVAVAACLAGDAARAKKYYGTLLHAHRRGLDALCAQQNIVLRAPPPEGVPVTLDADMIAETLEPLKARLALCVMENVPERRGFRATVAGATAANGTVSRVDVRGPWAACAGTLLRATKFPATSAGSTFAYDFFVDPSVLRPEKAIAHAERWFAQGKSRDAIGQWVWIAQTPEHLERAFEMACAAGLGADALLFGWQLDPTHARRCQRSPSPRRQNHRRRS